MQQFTKEQAIAFAKSEEWKDWTDEEIVRFQIYQRRLCIDLDRFHIALGNVLGRLVYICELADRDAIIDEYERERSTPTFEEIINMIPKEKQILFSL